ncbi:MAG: PAS domain S-box protein [Gemmatimonadota bacterium]|jgi:PAS domain S-box-containing protein
MDIRTKLVFALVTVALVSMAALGVVMSVGAMNALREQRFQQLEGLAEAKMEALEHAVTGWKDRVRLIASRTQLRLSLREHVRTGDADALVRMERILTDAVEPAVGVESLMVRAPDGRRLVAVARRGEPPELADSVPPPPAVPDDSPSPVSYDGLVFVDGRVLVGFRAPLVLEGESLGTLHVRLAPRELLELAAIRRGLGETGETVIVLPGPNGVVHTIRASEGGSAILSEAVDSSEAPDPVRLAVEGREGLLDEGLIDAGGDEVWAVVRHLGDVAWSLVVKLDVREGEEPVVALRQQLTTLSLSLGAFAILAGIILGFRITRPILDLSAVADRIRHGELDARATIATHDEVGLLARTFNEMAGELEERMTELREYHAFFELSRDLLCIAGTDGYFKKVNPAFERTVGWSEEELLSRPITSFVHPEDVDVTGREIEQLAEGIPSISFENRWRHAEGGYRHLRWTCHPEPETGLLYAVARDVTEPPEAEGR